MIHSLNFFIVAHLCLFYFEVISNPTIPIRISRANSILMIEALSLKQQMPRRKVPIAPMPVQMMYAVLTGIVLWAKYRKTPLNAILTIAKFIQVQKRSG